jgi:hypothetical protein
MSYQSILAEYSTREAVLFTGAPVNLIRRETVPCVGMRGVVASAQRFGSFQPPLQGPVKAVAA